MRCLRWLRTASSWAKGLSLPETLWILRSVPLQLKIRHNKSQREMSIAVKRGHIFSERTYAKIINKRSGTKRRWWTLFLPIGNLGWPNWELVTCEFYVRSRGATRR
jgi:hypothetical protein